MRTIWMPAAVLVLAATVASPAPVAEWEFVNAVNEPAARHENGYIQVGNRYYLLGGRGQRRVQFYNTNNNTWVNGPFPPGDEDFKLHHFQAVLFDGLIYVMGAYQGTFPDEPTVPNIYTYDPDTDEWAVGPDMPAGRNRGSAGAVVYNNRIYLVGGSTGGHGAGSERKRWFDAYDPSTNMWTTLPDMPRARDHFHAAVIGTKLYVAGGRNGDPINTTPQVDVYDFVEGAWSTLPPGSNLPTPRAGAATAVLGSNLILIGGESNQTAAHDEVHALDVTTGTWRSLDPLNEGRHGTQAIVDEGRIFIAAGAAVKGGDVELDTQEMLNAEDDPTLPVELTAFDAHADGDAAMLAWTTGSETNNAGFEIEHDDGTGFRRTGYVAGAGTSDAARTYAFRAEGLAPGTHRFRLRQVDFDGAFAYSPVVTVSIALDAAFMLSPAYPNPFNPSATFSLAVRRSQQVAVEVYDLMGRRMAVVNQGVLDGDRTYTFNVDGSGWASGTYVIVASGEFFHADQVITLLK